jgi:hypothetical protein
MALRRPLLATALFAAGCAGDGRPIDSSLAPPSVLRFRMESREMTYEDCIAGSTGCTYVRFDYPTVVDAPPGSAVEAVTAAIDSFLEAPLRAEEPPASMNGLSARFLAEFAALKTSSPRSEETWFLERKAFVLRSAPELLSLSFSERSFRGGDGETATLRYLNLDPMTGAERKLADVLEEGALPSLAALIAPRLLEKQPLSEGPAFDEAALSLTENFAFREDGLVFYVDPGGVGTEVTPAAEIVLPRKEVQSLLKPEFAWPSAKTPQRGTTSAEPHREQ